jgi:hypothetical protein
VVPNDRQRRDDKRRPDEREKDEPDDRRQKDRERKDDSRNEVERADREREKAVQRAIDDYAKLVSRYQDDGRRPHVTPWLLIRYMLADLGLRPIPPATNFWTSPDIWVESSDPLGNPVAGEANFVHARIFNLGAFDAAPVRVDFYWGDPSLGLGPGTMIRINPPDKAEWVEVKSMQYVDVRCNTAWVPVVVNGGHECLMVNCTCPILDPITHPLECRLDRHVGQRNVHVVEAPAGTSFKFFVNLHNTLAFGGRARIVARVEHVLATAAARQLVPQELLGHLTAFGGPSGETADEMRHRFRPGAPEHRTARRLARRAAARRLIDTPLLSGRGGFEGPARAAPGIAAQVLGESTIVRPGRARETTARLLLAADRMADGTACLEGGPYTTLQELHLQPFERRGLELVLHLPADVRAGEYVVFHIAQQVEGMVTGGYTIVAKTPKQGGERDG